MSVKQRPEATARLGHQWNAALGELFKVRPTFASYGSQPASYGSQPAIYAPQLTANLTASYGGQTLRAEPPLPEFFKSWAEVEEWKDCYPTRRPTSRSDMLFWKPDVI